MTRAELDALVVEWQATRCLPPADPVQLSAVLLDALADSWNQLPEALRDAVLAVAATLCTAPLTLRANGQGRRDDGA